jgi:hypothetical protein
MSKGPKQSYRDLIAADVPHRSRRSADIAGHRQQEHRQQDRADNDGDGDDDDELIWRFRDLKRKQIVNCWPTLSSWIRNEGFPPGFMLGGNSRGWLKADIMHWLKTRPAERTTKKRQHDHATT